VAETFLFAHDFPDEKFVDFKKFFWAVNKFCLPFWHGAGSSSRAKTGGGCVRGKMLGLED